MTEGVERVLSHLEVEFDAAIARDEEVAADDLALSLDQDRNLAQAVSAVGGLRLFNREGASRSVVEIGNDYLLISGPEEAYVPLARAVVLSERDCPRPRRTEDTFLDVLRRWSREHRRVAIETRAGRFEGELSRARRDHVQLEVRDGAMLIPLPEVLSARPTLGD